MSEQPVIRILIVEDHYVTRLGLKVSLELSPDMQVIGEAANGQAAVELATELKPDVILMDISMPVMDGIQAARQIKNIMPATRILMLTTHDHENDVYAAFSAGADGYCLKDSTTEHITMAIRVLNGGAVWLHPEIAKRVLAGSVRPVASGGAPVSPAASPIENFSLSAREQEILELLVEGLTNQQMAERLYLSHETIKTHMRHIMEKLQVSHRTEAAVKALRSGFVAKKSPGT